MEVAALALTLRAIGADAVGRAMTAVRKELKATADAAKATDSQMEGLKSQLAGMAASIGAAFGAREVVGMADSYATLTARLKIATSSAEELRQVQAALFAIAQNQRVPLEAVSDLYGRMALSADALGLAQADLLQLTTTISQALVVSGTSAEAAGGALMQLGQALGGGIVRAEEFNSILEGTPRLARAAAEGMGLTVSELRNLVVEGKVSSQAFAQAILANRAVAQEFATIPRTIGGAFTQLRNDILRMVGVLDQANGLSQQFVGTIDALRRNFPAIAGAIAGAAAAWAAYNVALRTAIVLNGIVTAAQTLSAFLSLAKTVRSLADAAALFSLTSGSMIKALAIVVSLAAGYAAFDTIMTRLEGSMAGVTGQMGAQSDEMEFQLRTQANAAKLAAMATQAAKGGGKTGSTEKPLSAFEEYFRQQGLGRKPLPSQAADSFLPVIDPAKIRASAQEIGALIDLEYTKNLLDTVENLNVKLRDTLANGIAAAFETLVTRGANIGDAFGALGATLLRGLGDMLVQFGTSLLPVAKLFGAVVTSLKSLNPVAMTAAAVGLIAVGAMMRGAAGRAFGGVGGGSAPVIAGGGLGGSSGPMTLPGISFGPTAASSAAAVTPSRAISFTVIGTNDPRAQRDIQELLRNADRRGGTTTV